MSTQQKQSTVTIPTANLVALQEQTINSLKENVGWLKTHIQQLNRNFEILKSESSKKDITIRTLTARLTPKKPKTITTKTTSTTKKEKNEKDEKDEKDED